MNQLENKAFSKYFTIEMGNNNHFDFSSLIRADMKTFLIAISGNSQDMIIYTVRTNLRSPGGTGSNQRESDPGPWLDPEI